MRKSMRETVLAIYYTDQKKKRHFETQGKFFYWGNRPVFLADMTQNKLWRNFNGYSIAKQILEAFSRTGVRPKIIYRRRDLGMIYLTTPTMFKKKGIFLNFGSHEQWVLPLKNYKAMPSGVIGYEPKDLPIMAVDDWVKLATREDGFGSSAQNQMKIEDYSMPDEVRLKLLPKWREIERRIAHG